MIRKLALPLLPLALAMSLPVCAQGEAPQMTPEEQAMMEAFQKAGTPGAPHAALEKMTGDYELSVKSWHAPGAPPSVEAGTSTRRMALGGRVLIEETTSSMMGQPFSGMGLHGYDNVSGKHWSTWNDSLSTGLMVSEGDCDDQGSCTLHGSWNDPITKGKITARMTTRWTDANTEIFEMFGPGPDGKEMQMMEITYRRKP
jgi:hypothetical protein